MDFSFKVLALNSILFVSFLWGIILFFGNYKTKLPGYYMSFIMLSIFLTFASIIPFYNGNYNLLVRLDALFFAGVLSILPFIFFYLRVITTRYQLKLFEKARFLHFVPAVLFCLISFFIQFLLSKEEQLIYALNQDINEHHSKMLRFFGYAELAGKICVILQFPFYLIKISFLIKKYKNTVRNYFSNIDNKYFTWIHSFYILFGISAIAGIPPLMKGNTYLIDENNNLLTLCFLTLSVITFYIAYIANVLRVIEDDNFYKLNTETETIKYVNYNATFYNELVMKLKQYFENEKPYLNQDLKINDVASALNTNRTYIYEIIKTNFNTNFSQYVNSHRVNEAIKLFKSVSHDNLSTADISEKVGFNTYLSFTKSFKSQFGCTPAAYRKMNVDQKMADTA